MSEVEAYGRLDLSGRAYIVTGGGSGLGAATARLISNRGGSVLVADVQAEAADRIANEIRDAGGSAVSHTMDVSVEQEVADTVAAAVRQFGRLDGAFNNAGIPGETAAIGDMPSDGWARTLGINLNGAFYCLKHETAYMAEHGGGSIVNTSSGAASVVAYPNQADYVASKAGVLGLTRAAAVDYAKRNIRVNAVLPGLVETGMTSSAISSGADIVSALLVGHPIGRYAQAWEVAEAVCWLLSDAASFVTGVSLPVDGGYLASK